MADQDHFKTHIRETSTTQTSGTGMALIVGGLVVAVAFVLWLVFGASEPVNTTAPTSDTNITIEPQPEPVVPDPAAPVPAVPADETGTAPIIENEGTAPAPVTPPVTE